MFCLYCQIYFLNALVETAALAGTIFAHPAGMLITAAKDLACEAQALGTYLEEGRYSEAMESGAKVLNQALYLALFTSGGLSLAVDSLTVQVLLGIHQAQKAYSEGSYIEAAGHVCMALIKGKQLSCAAGQLEASQSKQTEAVAVNKTGPSEYKLEADLAQYKG